MGYVYSKTTKKKGKVWCISFSDPEGRRHREVVGLSKMQAQEALSQVESEVINNRFFEKRKPKVLFKDFAREYWDLHCAKLRSSSSQKVQLNVVMPFFGDKNLDEITPMDIERFKVSRTDHGRKPATINRSLALLKCMFNEAIRWGKFSGVNPMTRVKSLKENNKRIRYLSDKELVALLTHTRGHCRLAILIALNTGIRRGNILSLKWTDLDFNDRVIRVREPKNQEQFFARMNDVLADELLRYPRHPESPYIFYNQSGAQIKDIKCSFHSACKRAGIANLRFHDLRHDVGSRLARKGVPLNDIREVLGHKSIAMTQRYAHLSPGRIRDAITGVGHEMAVALSACPGAAGAPADDNGRLFRSRLLTSSQN